MEIINEPGLRKRDMALLVAVALLFDFLSLLPGENVLVGVFGQAVIPFVFSRYGINIFSYKKILPYIVATIIEVVPGASILAAFTVETIIIIWLSRKMKHAE